MNNECFNNYAKATASDDMTPLEILCQAVIYKAVRDYTSALIKYNRTSGATKERCRVMIEDCESFFQGDEFNIYTGLDGPTLMNKAKRMALAKL